MTGMRPPPPRRPARRFQLPEPPPPPASRRPSMMPQGRLEPRRLSGIGPAAVPQELATPLWAAAAFFVAGILFVVTLLYALQTGNRNVLGGLLIVPPLAVITAFIARRLADVDRDNMVVSLVMGGFALKMIGAAVRYGVAYDAYGGAIDATGYHTSGRELAAQFRHFDFATDLPGRLVGTNFVRVVTGVFYTITPATRLTGFLIFSWIAFLGAIFYWRAFKVAMPGANTHKYALLLFVMPSMLYWPSAIGKDAWMMLTLGLCALGVSRLLTRGIASGILFVALGVYGVSMVRPHVGILVMNGLVFGALLNTGKGRSPMRIFLVVGVVLVVAVSVMSRTQEFFGVESINRESFEEVLDDTASRTSQGGSEYDPVRVRTPIDLPLAFGTVFYRPFVFEASNAQLVASAVEGMLLALLTALSWPSLKRVPRELRKSPYLGYCVGAILTFIVAFSAFSNFGILARQRMQIVPLFYALLCITAPRADALAELHDDR
ncbi:MAG TPA: hypothetical protein VFZ83_02080 [Acidimicrobiia bacterium]|nr:hypothetical protein [Acidimicrobiia bacterium]